MGKLDGRVAVVTGGATGIGRGIAMLITKGQITTINSAPYRQIAGGYLFGLPIALATRAASRAA